MIISYYIRMCLQTELSTKLYIEAKSLFSICLNGHLVVQIWIHCDNTLQSQYQWF